MQIETGRGRKSRHVSEAEPSEACVLELEERMMFDGAAGAEAADAVTDADVSQEADQSRAEASSLVAAAAASVTQSERDEIYFIDPGVPDIGDLIGSIPDSSEIVVLNASSDGVEQIASVLRDRSDIDAIHIVSHGDEGRLELGDAALTLESMQGEHADAIGTIGDALTADGDILIYGCDFTSGEAGFEAAAMLSSLTGGDVAASDDTTGSAELGGDWKLESRLGDIEAIELSNTEWGSVLAVGDIDDDGVADENDIDTDNDGILDINEGVVTHTDISTATPTSGGSSVSVGTSTITYSQPTSGVITYTANGGDDIPFGAISNTIDGFDINSGGTLVVDFVPEENTGVAFSSGDLDQGEIIDIAVYDADNVLIADITPYIMYNDAPSNSVTSGGATESATITDLSSAGGATFDFDNHVDFFIPFAVSRIEVTDVNDPSGSAEFFITRVDVVKDTDGDGIADHLDLDSDNDGIADLRESGTSAANIAADTNNDGTMSIAEAEAVLGAGNADADGDGLLDVFDGRHGGHVDFRVHRHHAGR